MHFTTESEGLMRFPHQYPPPRPRPWRLSFACTAAFASRSRWTTESWPPWAAKCSGVWPQEPRPEAKPQAEPNRKFWVPQKSKFWKLWPLKNPPWTWGTVLLRKFWWHRVGWKRPCEPGWQSKCFAKTSKNVPSLRKQIRVRLGHNRVWNQSPAPCSRYFV